MKTWHCKSRFLIIKKNGLAFGEMAKLSADLSSLPHPDANTYPSQTNTKYFYITSLCYIYRNWIVSL